MGLPRLLLASEEPSVCLAQRCSPGFLPRPERPASLCVPRGSSARGGSAAAAERRLLGPERAGLRGGAASPGLPPPPRPPLLPAIGQPRPAGGAWIAGPPRPLRVRPGGDASPPCGTPSPCRAVQPGPRGLPSPSSRPAPPPMSAPEAAAGAEPKLEAVIAVSAGLPGGNFSGTRARGGGRPPFPPGSAQPAEHRSASRPGRAWEEEGGAPSGLGGGPQRAGAGPSSVPADARPLWRGRVLRSTPRLLLGTRLAARDACSGPARVGAGGGPCAGLQEDPSRAILEVLQGPGLGPAALRCAVWEVRIWHSFS